MTNIANLARQHNIPAERVYKRLRANWSLEEALGLKPRAARTVHGEEKLSHCKGCQKPLPAHKILWCTSECGIKYRGLIHTRQKELHAPLKCTVCARVLEIGDKYTARGAGSEKCLGCSGIIEPC